MAKQPTIEEEPKEASKELNGASADNASSPAEEAEEGNIWKTGTDACVFVILRSSSSRIWFH